MLGYSFSLSCLAASLAVLCGLTHFSADCREDRATFIECDIQVTVGTSQQRGSVSYLYICGDMPPQGHFAGLFARLVPCLSNSQVGPSMYNILHTLFHLLQNCPLPNDGLKEQIPNSHVDASRAVWP